MYSTSDGWTLDILLYKKENKKTTLFGHFDQKQKCSVFTFVQYTNKILSPVVHREVPVITYLAFTDPERYSSVITPKPDVESETSNLGRTAKMKSKAKLAAL